MKVRPFRDSDASTLKAIGDASGFPYPEDLSHPHIEAVLVVTDDGDKIIAACAAKRLVELYGWFDPKATPSVKMAAIRLLHVNMGKCLRDRLYETAELFLPPSIAARFGRRLERSFGWAKNWTSWTRRL